MQAHAWRRHGLPAISLASQPGDQRMNVFDFNNVLGASPGIGLHGMDYTLSQGDMIDMLSAQSGALSMSIMSPCESV